MFVAVRRYIVTSGNEAEAVRHSQEHVVPMMQSIPGFVSYYFADIGMGEMLGISVFDSQESARQANQLAGAYVEKHLSAILRRTNLYEGTVVAHALPD